MKNGQYLLNKLSKKFLQICGFDIADNRANNKREAIEKARQHIKWFRDWAEESAQAMEAELGKIEYPRR